MSSNQMLSYIILKRIRNCPKPELTINYEELSKELNITEDNLVKVLKDLELFHFIENYSLTFKDADLVITNEGKDFLKGKRKDVEDYILKSIDNSSSKSKLIEPNIVANEVSVLKEDVVKFINEMESKGLISITGSRSSGALSLSITDIGRNRIEGVEEGIPIKIESPINVTALYGSIYSNNQSININQIDSISIGQINQNVDQVINESKKNIEEDVKIQNKVDVLKKIEQIGYHAKEIWKIIKSFEDNKIVKFSISMIKKIFGL